MEYLNESKLKESLRDLAKVEERANEFIQELYNNGNFSDLDVISFIKKPEDVEQTIKKIGYDEAKRFSIATQRNLFEQQADATAKRLKQLSKSIFYDTTLSYEDIENACYLDEGIFKVDEKKANELLTKKFTHELTPFQLELYSKLNNLCAVLNSLNTYAEKTKIIRCIDINLSDNLISGGLHPVFRERRPYEVNIDNVIKIVK